MPRNLPDGSTRAELDAPVKRTIDTKCPLKWAFVDMETSLIFVPNGEKDEWRRPSDSDLRCITLAIEKSKQSRWTPNKNTKRN